MSTDLQPARVWDRCEQLARCSELAGGLTRVFLSGEQRAASELTLDWMRAAGMTARLDAIGNVVGRYEGQQPGLPCLMLGSHLDTVRDAGKYDGMLGVVTAVECVHVLNTRGKRLPFAVEVVGFADEEGVRFGSTLLGSRAVAGTFQPDVLDKADATGITMREALQRFGLDPHKIGSAARSRKEILGYAELHIEQGPVLEAEGLAVGVVTAINGASRFQFEIDGMAGHAGTVPMNLRQDALAAAAACVLAIEERARRTPDLVGTVGRIDALPGATNVIPGKVRFTLDLRSPRDGDRTTAAADIKRSLADLCAARNVRLVITPTHENRTTPCARWLMDQFASAIAADGLPVRELPSGAGHDGMAMIDCADIGMLFVRCEKGISHNPAEAITLADVEVGTRVLLRFIEQFTPRASA